MNNYPSTAAMKAAVEMEILACIGHIQTQGIGALIQKAIDAETDELRKQLENAKWPPKRDDIYRAIDTNVRSEPDKHFIDRRWLVGVNDAVDAILALTDEQQGEAK